MTRETILVVDDEPGMVRAVTRVLGSRYTVVGAAGAAEALTRAAERPPDVAILDLRMPETDGWSLIPLLRERCPGVDVIVMTGSVQELDAQHVRAIREQAYYFVQKPFEREVLLTLVERCVEQRRLAAANRAHTARLEAELAAARAFWSSLLPAAPLELGPCALHARCLPCDELGGDLVDFAPLPREPERAAFVVADVSGHGVAAAMLTGLVKSAFRDALEGGADPSEVIRRVSRAIAAFGDDRFVTLFAGRTGPDRVLEHASAGHPPAFLCGPERALERLGLTGPLVSPAFGDLGWELARRELTPGDRLLVYTDGITEARGEEGELLGEARLAELWTQSTARGDGALAELLAAERAFAAGRPADDDCTLLAVEWR